MMKHASDQIIMMQNGEVMERSSTTDVLAASLHNLSRRFIARHFGEALTTDAWRRGGATPQASPSARGADLHSSERFMLHFAGFIND